MISSPSAPCDEQSRLWYLSFFSNHLSLRYVYSGKYGMQFHSQKKKNVIQSSDCINCMRNNRIHQHTEWIALHPNDPECRRNQTWHNLCHNLCYLRNIVWTGRLKIENFSIDTFHIELCRMRWKMDKVLLFCFCFFWRFGFRTVFSEPTLWLHYSSKF